MGQVAAERLPAHQLAEAGAVEAVERSRLVEVVGHRQRRALQVARILLHIGVGDRQRRADDRLGPDLEPAVEADVERDRGDDGDHDRRHRGDQREHRDDAHMQARRRLAVPPREVDAVRFAGDQADQHQHEAGIDGDQRQRRRLVGGDRCRPDENGEGYRGPDQRGENRHHARQGEQAPRLDGRRLGKVRRVEDRGIASHQSKKAMMRRMYATHCGDCATFANLEEGIQRLRVRLRAFEPAAQITMKSELVKLSPVASKANCVEAPLAAIAVVEQLARIGFIDHAMAAGCRAPVVGWRQTRQPPACLSR